MQFINIIALIINVVAEILIGVIANRISKRFDEKE